MLKNKKTPAPVGIWNGSRRDEHDSHVVVPLRFLLPDNSRTAAKFAKL